MRLSITQTHRVDGDVDPVEAATELVNYVLGKVGMSDRQWINAEGVICEDEWYGHGSPIEHHIGTATPAQREARDVTERLMKLVRSA